ncbi:phenylalanine--tRNA ligase subunit alpha [Candidatus Micrarchaeota archaeon]|nr:phenylalanine--tRNA ligase subunit alpha [Candidatus Micrarchaeota archaeon]
MLKENELLVLNAVKKKTCTIEEITSATGLSESTVMSVLSSLEEKQLVSLEKQVVTKIVLSKEGLLYSDKGTPEKRLFDSLKGKETELNEALKHSGLSDFEKGIALQWIVKTNLAKIDKKNDKTFLVPVGRESEFDSLIELLKEGEPVFGKEKLLSSRKLVELKEEKNVTATVTNLGLKASSEKNDFVSQLTPQLLRDGSWKNKKFSSYDLNTLVKQVDFGRKHPYKQFVRGIKEKLVGLGFKEVHGHFVELEFWNMDALFMAQDHPARELHDVFMVDGVQSGEVVDKNVLNQVKKAHESGLSGSKGWQYKWDAEIATRLVLRSQTTTLSARQLASGLKPPTKLFSIGRVFRPDEIDWKHFIEFNQCEGIVLDDSVSLRELLGYLKEFAVEVFGAKKVKFVPSYFPFTEPSVEMYTQVPGKGMIEVGGAGMFRPEMLAGLGVKHPVLAWGLGIDRLAMNAMGITDIRDLFTQNLELLRK